MEKLSIVLLLQVILFWGCHKDNPTESDNELSGYYESSTFVEPGANDGGVNILASGGYLKISFKDDFSYSAEMFIPVNISSNYSSGITNYEGSYSVVNNTIKFNSSFIVDELVWEKENKVISSKDVPVRGQPFKIVLYKNIK